MHTRNLMECALRRNTRRRERKQEGTERRAGLQCELNTNIKQFHRELLSRDSPSKLFDLRGKGLDVVPLH